MTPVLHAASHGHLKLLQMLVKAGATVMARNRLGQTLFHCAAQRGHLGIIRYAVEDLEGIPVDDPDQSGKTPLMLAAVNGCSDVLTYLHSLGCDLQTIDKESNNALHLASGRGHAELLGYLMHGIHSDAHNQDGLTALHSSPPGAGQLRLREGAAGQRLPGQCGSALFISSRQTPNSCLVPPQLNLNPCTSPSVRGIRTSATVLLQEGIDVNATGNKDPCLHLAVKHNFPPLFQCLIAAGCDVNICDHRRQSALHVAVERRQPAVVEQLLRVNINLHLQDQQGRTALDLAVRSQHAALADMIIKAERFHARRLGAEAQAEGGEGLDLSYSRVRDLTRVRSVLWTLATRHQKPGHWKRLAQHWNFSAKHIKALESQWTGSDSYKEHGYRMLLIWLHGVASAGRHPIKELYESLVEIGSPDLAEKVRRQANAEGESSRRCVVV
ncbi:ankyrin repeat and death domain-containing protein 1A-like [Pristis pectinata]|uniref:ankyrin repeat and death domain-containing protein 1A-like n=1 Tax=Pristis pectinata TaxID=685728 RepID=UPI00223C986E|nr:ankyrin repeat and death domain-containing protein 1A-like [Pristis pectinata]